MSLFQLLRPIEYDIQRVIHARWVKMQVKSGVSIVYVVHSIRSVEIPIDFPALAVC